MQKDLNCLVSEVHTVPVAICEVWLHIFKFVSYKYSGGGYPRFATVKDPESCTTIDNTL